MLVYLVLMVVICDIGGGVCVVSWIGYVVMVGVFVLMFGLMFGGVFD